jgi:glutamate racemase
MPDPTEAIGIFDSGVGGLTVLRQVAARLPGESLLYFGDTARVPYGTKSPQTVIRYARQSAEVLLSRGIKMLVVACNTASAFALDALRERLDVPVLGVIEPGARAAVRKSASGRIGVIGTVGTVASRAYPDAIARIAPKANVLCQSCPLFVPLAEEGWTEGDVPRAIAERYLQELLRRDIDTLILGCTHYPLLAGILAEIAGPAVALVDSAEETAITVEKTLSTLGLRSAAAAGERHFLVSDAPENFARIGKRFLGYALDDVKWVDF